MSRLGTTIPIPTIPILLSLVLAAPTASAQYFGRNKVQYEDFDFEVLQTEHFDIYFYTEEEQAANDAAEMAERWYQRLSSVLDYDLHGTQPIIVYASHPHFEQTNVLSGLPGEGTGGVTESLKRRIVMPFAGPLAETDHVLGHELVHAFQYDMTSQNRSAASSSLRFPLWFMEGMAEYLSLGPVDVMTAAWMRDAAIRDDLPDLNELSDPEYFPYRYGHAFWAYLAGRYGDDVVGDIMSAAASGGGALPAVTSVTQQDAETLGADWHESIRRAYEPLLSSPRLASDYGRALLTDEKGGGTVNVAPSLSPDGSRLVFLSERDLFSIEMFVADAETGEVQSKIVETATDPHFESLQFIASAGSWSPDGERFVFAGVTAGQPVLSFLDVDEGEVVREIRFPRLGEIFNPRWSPDGERVAFTAIRGGLLDLYVVEIASEKLTRLTEDAYAELHPAWSPDGRKLVFASDRFGSSLDRLSMGRYRLATLDVDSGRIEPLPLFDNADHWDPQWIASGLFFVSDRGGRPNLYRFDAKTQRIRQVTDLSTGVFGITKLSPAFTVAEAGDRLLFTVREEQEYRIYRIDEPRTLAGAVPQRGRPHRTWAALPPVDRETSQVARFLGHPVTGLPDRSSFPEKDYDADLSLDYVGQPYLVAGSGPFGSFVGGGLSFFWSDMLGNHNLGTQFQLTGDLDNFAGIVGYENRDHRWNWGGSVSWIPFISNRFASGVAEVEGQPSQVDQLIQFKQTERRVRGTLSYPFNRSQRVELSGGFVSYGFSTEAKTRAFSLVTGEQLRSDTTDLPSPSSLNLGEGAAALVHDTSVFGPTSPLLGTRYRLEGGASLGTIDFGDVLADFRQYFMPKRPFTVALRGMHFGRYGGDSEDERLNDLYLGYPNLVRGYQAGSFSADECASDGGCPVFDRLLGSKLLVANAELRFPLLGVFSGEPWSGPIPIELALFGDAGVAWTSDRTPSFFGGDQKPVSSAGVAVRVAVQSFLVVELDLVRPFDRPQKGWIFEFNFKPGF